MKSHRSALLCTASMAVLLGAGSSFSVAAGLATVEAESGTLGSDFAVSNSSSPAYITILTVGGGSNPTNAARVASYTVNFPAAGTYDLYARLRVGSGGFNDDSLFYGNAFGVKSPTVEGDWQTVNGLSTGGFTAPGDVVAGNGSAGNQVWKWVNLSQFNPGGSGTEPPITFTVPGGGLTQTFQIAAREDGLDMDKFAFGTSGTSFTVSNLDNGTLPPPPPPPPTNTFVGPDGIAFHRFSPLNNNTNAEGANPAAGLALFGGVLCGTTLNGGLQGAGTAFYMSLDGTNFNAFHSFTNAGNPMGELAVSGNGFFGTSFGGGSSGVGAVYVGQTNGSVSVIRNFVAVYPHTATNVGGASPTALLALSGNKIYGTTTAGGAAANGTVFSVLTNGTGFAVMHDFTFLDSNTGTNADGAIPWGGLVLSGDTLYGTASGGGAGGNGVVFSLNTNGGSFFVLHHFTPIDTLTATNTDGAMPFGGLVLSNSTLYGTTIAGGTGGNGTIFSIGADGLGFNVLHHFSALDAATRTNTDGASPAAGLTLSGDVLYGTTSAGGTNANGAVFSVNTNGTQFKAIYSFATLSNGTNKDGAFPVAPVLVLGNSLYGTTFSGGPGSVGTVFSIPLPAVPAVPAVITNIVHNPDNSVTLYFLGGPSSTNVIQTTTDLTPPIAWQNVSTNVADVNGAWQFTDSNNTTATRYYRSYAP